MFWIKMFWIIIVCCVAAFQVDDDASAVLRRILSERLVDNNKREALKPDHVRRSVTMLSRGGLGDEMSGFFAAVAFAMLTKRRLEIPKGEGFFSAGLLEVRFDVVQLNAEGRLGAFTAEPTESCNADGLVVEWLRRTRRASGDSALTNLHCGSRRFIQLAHEAQVRNSTFGDILNQHFDRRREFVVFGDVGKTLFYSFLDSEPEIRRVLARRGRSSRKYYAQLLAATARYLVRPSSQVEAMAEAIAPWGPTKPGLIVAIVATRDNECTHLRASALDDIWTAARLAQVDLAFYNPHLRGIKASWLLVTESASLEAAAAERRDATAWKTNATACRHGRLVSNATMLQTLAELFVVARTANAIVHTNSRFSTTAALFCKPCSRVLALTSCDDHDIKIPPVARACRTDAARRKRAIGHHIQIDQLGGSAPASNFVDLLRY